MSKKYKTDNTIKVPNIELNGMTNEVTYNTDVTSDPFPFTEENNKSYEHVEYGKIP